MAWYKESIRHRKAAKGIKTVSKNITNRRWLYSDLDKDKVKNYKDCRPLDPKRHGRAAQPRQPLPPPPPPPPPPPRYDVTSFVLRPPMTPFMMERLGEDIKKSIPVTDDEYKRYDSFLITVTDRADAEMVSENWERRGHKTYITYEGKGRYGVSVEKPHV